MSKRTHEEALEALILMQNKYCALRAENKWLTAEVANLRLRLQLIASCALAEPSAPRKPELIVDNGGKDATT
jgi:hypothetical protein